MTSLTSSTEWKDDVLQRVMDILADDPDTLNRVLDRLEQEDRVWDANPETIPLVWRILKNARNNPAAFQAYVKALNKKAITPDTDVQNSSWSNMPVLPTAELKGEVLANLTEKYASDPEALTRVLHYLEEEDRMCRSSSEPIALVWPILKSLLNNAMALKNYIDDLINNTKTIEKEEGYLTKLNALYEEMKCIRPRQPNQIDDAGKQEEDTSLDMPKSSTFGTLAMAWPQLSPAAQALVLQHVRHVSILLNQVVGFLDRTTGAVVLTSLAGVFLTYEIVTNIWRWWHGEISGARCAKNIIDGLVTVGAGLAGTMGGAVAGAFAGPVGMLVGGIIGGVVSSVVANRLSSRLTLYLFSLPREEALENAYRYLGVDKDASNGTINLAFRRLCLQHHPDKVGGSAEEFQLLQIMMTTIKLGRGEASVGETPVLAITEK